MDFSSIHVWFQVSFRHLDKCSLPLAIVTHLCFIDMFNFDPLYTACIHKYIYMVVVRYDSLSNFNSSGTTIIHQVKIHIERIGSQQTKEYNALCTWLMAQNEFVWIYIYIWLEMKRRWCVFCVWLNTIRYLFSSHDVLYL